MWQKSRYKNLCCSRCFILWAGQHNFYFKKLLQAHLFFLIFTPLQSWFGHPSVHTTLTARICSRIHSHITAIMSGHAMSGSHIGHQFDSLLPPAWNSVLTWLRFFFLYFLEFSQNMIFSALYWLSMLFSCFS